MGRVATFDREHFSEPDIKVICYLELESESKMC